MRILSLVRKAFLFSSIAVLYIASSSCTKTVIGSQSYTYTYTINSGDWTPPPGATGGVWQYTVPVSGITQNTLSNYTILVYYSQSYIPGGSYTQTLMPFSLEPVDYYYQTGINSNGFGYVNLQVSAVGAYANVDPSTYVTSGNTNVNNPVSLKIVIIPQ